MPLNPQQPPYPEYTPIVTQGMYRFVYVTDKPLPNGSPDLRIQKWYDYPKQGYKDIYHLDNQQQNHYQLLLYILFFHYYQ